jgi:hypothetical protein
MWKALLVFLIVPLSGCVSLTGPSSIDTTNQMIVESNKDRLTNYGQAMAACGDNAACQVGVSLAFAGNMGQQSLYRPETALDYVRELRGWIAPLSVFWGGSGDGSRGANVVRGDGNVIMVGNETRAENASSVSQPVTAEYTRHYDQLNRTYTGLQPITDAGLGEVTP